MIGYTIPSYMVPMASSDESKQHCVNLLCNMQKYIHERHVQIYIHHFTEREGEEEEEEKEGERERESRGKKHKTKMAQTSVVEAGEPRLD